MMFQPLDVPMPRQLPSTVEQVVSLLYDDLSLRDRVVIANLSEDELESSLYRNMANMIRKEFALYRGNTELLESCCRLMGWKYGIHEDPVMVILKELWHKTRATHRLHLVEAAP